MMSLFENAPEPYDDVDSTNLPQNIKLSFLEISRCHCREPESLPSRPVGTKIRKAEFGGVLNLAYVIPQPRKRPQGGKAPNFEWANSYPYPPVSICVRGLIRMAADEQRVSCSSANEYGICNLRPKTNINGLFTLTETDDASSYTQKQSTVTTGSSQNICELPA
jgi:hypothetical protein